MTKLVIILYPVAMLAALVWIHIEVQRDQPSRAFRAVLAVWDAIENTATVPINWIIRRMS